MDIEKNFQEAQFLRDNQQIPDAVAAYQRTREAAIATGNKHLAAESLHMIGVAFYQAEDLIRAEEQLLAAEQEFNELGEQEFIGMVMRDRGLTALRGKDYTKAKTLMQQSIDILKEGENKGHLGMSMVKLGVITGREGNTAEAEQLIREGIDTIKGTPDVFFLSSAYFDLAKLQHDAGKTDEARNNAERSLELLNQLGGENRFVKRREELADFLRKTE